MMGMSIWVGQAGQERCADTPTLYFAASRPPARLVCIDQAEIQHWPYQLPLNMEAGGGVDHSRSSSCFMKFKLCYSLCYFSRLVTKKYIS